MYTDILIYSHFGILLVHDRNRSDNHSLGTYDIDFAQLYRFVSLCFTFSKCNVISSNFNGIHMVSIKRTYSFIVLLSKNHSSLRRKEFICNVLLYCFEMAYDSILDTINKEEMERSQNMHNNYTVHDIDSLEQNMMKRNNYSTKFLLFPHFIQETVESNWKVLCTEIPSDTNTNGNTYDFAIMLINASDHKSTSIIYEYSNHVVGFEMKQIVLKCNTANKTTTLRTKSGIWRILSRDVELWCCTKLFFIEKYPYGNDDYVIDRIKNHFETMVFVQDTQRLLRYIEKFKPKAPSSLRQTTGDKSFSRKRKYENKIAQQTNADDEQLNLVVIPVLPINKES